MTDQGTGNRVLIVDDNDDIRTMLSTRLAHAGYTTETAPDGASALTRLDGGDVDLVILDIMMPGMDGFEALRRIRERHSFSHLPVIMLSARDHGKEVVRAFRLGANDYAIKPANWEQLIGRIRTHLSLKAPNAPVLGGYQIMRKVGSGGMGMVYEATEVASGRHAALKVLPRSLTFDNKYVRRFVQEAELARRVDHPNVVRVFGAGVDGETYYIAMEFIDGQDVEVELRGRTMAPYEALRVARQAASGLDALTEAGILHRDIKPENLIISNDGRVKVTDLGVARAVDTPLRLTETGIGIGSMVYASPEQMHGKGDHRADIYSLGCTMFYMMTKQDPFDHEKPLTWIAERKRKPPPRLDSIDSSIPRSVADLVARMMAPNAGDRPATWNEVILRIDELLDSGLATPTDSPSRWWLWLSLAGAGIAGALGAWYAWMR